MATFEGLPTELINIIIKDLNDIDIINCSIALIGTKHKEFVKQEFLKPRLQPQLTILASLDINLEKSLRNEVWFDECSNTESIIRLWKKFNPLKSKYYSVCHKS